MPNDNNVFFLLLMERESTKVEGALFILKYTPAQIDWLLPQFRKGCMAAMDNLFRSPCRKRRDPAKRRQAAGQAPGRGRPGMACGGFPILGLEGSPSWKPWRRGYFDAARSVTIPAWVPNLP